MTLDSERMPSTWQNDEAKHVRTPEKAQPSEGAVSRVIRNSVLLSLQPFLLHLLSIFATAFIARRLGSDDFGRFNLALAFVAMASVLTNPGLRSVTLRRIAQEREEPSILVGQMLVLRALLALAALALLFGALPFLGASASTKYATAILGVTVLLAAANTVLIDCFQGLERMGPVLRANFIGGLLLTLSSILVLALGGRLLALAVAYVIGPLVTCILLSYDAFRGGLAPSFRWKWSSFRGLLLEGRSFFGLGALYLVMQRLDMVILARILGDGGLGSYAAATQLVSRVGVLTDGVTSAVAPAAYRLSVTSDSESKSLLRRAMTWLITLTLVFALGGTLLGGFVVRLVYGAGFEDAGAILAVFGWTLPLFAITGLFHQTLFVKNRQTDVLRIEVKVQAAAILLLLVGTIVGLGVGSAVAKVAGVALSAACALYAYRSELKATVPFEAIGKILAFACVLGAGYLLLRWLGGHPVIVALGIVVHTFGALYLAGRLELIPLRIPKGLGKASG